MSQLIKIIYEAVFDAIPVLLILLIAFALTIGGGMSEIIAAMVTWLIG